MSIEYSEQPVNSFVVMDDQPTPEPPRDGSSWDEYCQVQAMNGSTLVNARKSMLHLKHAIENPIEPTPPMQLGTATHAMLLEPETFEQRFCVMPDYHKDPENLRKAKNKSETDKDRRTESKATTYYKTKARQFFEVARAEGQEVVFREQYDNALAMIEAIRGNAEAAMWLEAPDARNEVTVVGEIEGVVCKGRIDILHPTALVDVKTAADVGPYQFSKYAVNAGYLFKQAIHRELVRQMTGRTLPVYYIAVESSAPFDCAVFEFSGGDEQVFDQELENVKRLLRKYRECLESEGWPGVDEGGGYVRFHIPDWAMGSATGVGIGGAEVVELGDYE